VGELHGKQDGPCVIIVVGVHGNEPAGVAAAERVIAQLAATPAAIRGDLWAFRGNRQALAQQRRFVDKDLNRLWSPDQVEVVRRTPAVQLASAEEREQQELLAAVEQACEGARGKVLLVDLHTASSSSIPFMVEGVGPLSEDARRLLPIPVVVDKPGFFKGTLLAWVAGRGHTSVVFEAGQHRAPESAQIHEASVWLVLAGVGALTKRCRPDRRRLQRQLAAGIQQPLPHAFELTYRYPVVDSSRFAMLNGFKNFDLVEAGELVAMDGRREVRCPHAGRIFLPLYQRSGEDGFFLVRDLSHAAAGLAIGKGNAGQTE